MRERATTSRPRLRSHRDLAPTDDLVQRGAAMLPVAFIHGLNGIGPYEMMLVGMIALLLFGQRLPEAALSPGKGVTEFKKGLKGFEEGMREADRTHSYTEIPHSHDTQTADVPKFELPESPPANEPSVAATQPATTAPDHAPVGADSK